MAAGIDPNLVGPLVNGILLFITNKLSNSSRSDLEIELARLREEVCDLSEGNAQLKAAMQSSREADAVIQQALVRLAEVPTYQWSLHDNCLTINVIQDATIIAGNIASGTSAAHAQGTLSHADSGGRALIDGFDAKVRELVEQNRRG